MAAPHNWDTHCVLCDFAFAPTDSIIKEQGSGWWAAHEDCLRRLRPDMYRQVMAGMHDPHRSLIQHKED